MRDTLNTPQCLSAVALLGASFGGVPVPMPELAAAARQALETQKPLQLRYALYQSEGLRHVVRLRSQAIQDVASTIGGKPMRYEHRPHAGREWILGADPHPLQGTILAAEVVQVEGRETLVGTVAVDGERTLDEMSRGMVPAVSIEFLGELESAQCSHCEARFAMHGGSYGCRECGSEWGAFGSDGNRVYLDYEHAEGIGAGFLYAPASLNTGPTEAEASRLEKVLNMVWPFRRKESLSPLAPVEAAEVGTFDPSGEAGKTSDVEGMDGTQPSDILAAENAELRAKIEAIEAAQAAEAEALAVAEAEAFAKSNKATIVGLMESGKILAGPRALELRAEDPERFDAILSCVPASPMHGTGLIGTGDRPPDLAPAEDGKAEAAELRRKARALELEKGIPYAAAVLEITAQKGNDK